MTGHEATRALHGDARLRRVLDVALDEITTRRGRIALFSVGVAAYALVSAFMPVEGGRDLGNYLRYYAQMWHSGTALPMTMLVRTPVAPVVAGGALDLGGGYLAQALLAVLFGLWLVTWTAVASAWGRRAALMTAIVLLVFPAYQILFHRLSTDVIFTFAFAPWALLLTRALLRPAFWKFAVLGLGIGLLGLVRPGNQVLVLVALLPLLLRGRPWRRRLVLAVAVPVATVAVLGPYAVYNGVRYGDYTVARGGNAISPFYRTYAIEHIVSPDNGPASRDLARAVRTNLLPEEPYRSYGVTLHDVFARGTARTWEDLVNLSDRVWGWDSNYGKLRAAAIEAIRKHPVTFGSDMLGAFFDTLWKPEYYNPVRRSGERAGSGGSAAGEDTVVIGGRVLPRPSGGDLIPAAHTGLSSATPDGSITEVWTSPVEHHLAFRNPAQAQRYERMNEEVDRLGRRLPPYAPQETLVLWFNRASRAFPRPLLWLLLGLLAVARRRPARMWTALALPAVGLLLIGSVGLGVAEYGLPVVPGFVVLSAVGLLGESRRRTADPAARPTSP